MFSCGKPPRYVARVLLSAWRKASLTFAAGEYVKVMRGEIECRMRVNGPNPGKNPNNVGELESPYWSVFDCVTNWPPLNWLRTQKPLVGSAFTIPMNGDSLSVLCMSDGKLMPVCQSMDVR